VKIGSINIEYPIILAPMAGITDYSFRIICKEQGAGVVYSEFVSAHGVVRGNEKSLDLIQFTEGERPIGIQIFGENPDIMQNAARKIVDDFKPDILDINFGCPVPKITKKGAGSAALKDLGLMKAITEAVVVSVPEIPVTVKMRSGWDKQSIVVEQAGTLLEKAGVKAVTLHPRTSNQSFKGKADWALIKKLKEIVSIPVIGNGDITCPQDVYQMMDETNCDAVMVGRVALGNPWFFKQTISLLRGDAHPLPQPTLFDRITTCQRHFDLILKIHGDRKGSYLMRKHFGWYIKGFPGASKYRNNLVTAPNLAAMKIELDKLHKLAANGEQNIEELSSGRSSYA
jgi:tRNA-dihydrouridine synthase B